MIVVSIDPVAARERYGVLGEIAANAASRALARGLEMTTERSGATSDLVLGGTILAAIGALAYHAHAARKGKRRRR